MSSLGLRRAAFGPDSGTQTRNELPHETDARAAEYVINRENGYYSLDGMKWTFQKDDKDGSFHVWADNRAFVGGGVHKFLTFTNDSMSLRPYDHYHRPVIIRNLTTVLNNVLGMHAAWFSYGRHHTRPGTILLKYHMRQDDFDGTPLPAPVQTFEPDKSIVLHFRHSLAACGYGGWLQGATPFHNEVLHPDLVDTEDDESERDRLLYQMLRDGTNPAELAALRHPRGKANR